MHPAVRQYMILVDFLGKVLGSDYEIVLHDLSGGRNQVVAIANNNISERTLGAPLTNLALKFLADKTYEQSDYQVGCEGISPKNARLSTSTLFIKDGHGKLVGILCINYDMTRCLRVQEAVESLCNTRLAISAPAGDDTPATEKFQGSVRDAVRASVAEITRDTGIPAGRLTMAEKIRIVGKLQADGMFYLKGAVSEVAACLNTSEATVYRYLSKIK